MNNFLFVHFTDNRPDGEQIYFSISQDGLNFYDLNHGVPILKNNIGEQGVRDPFIVRHPETNKFYIIGTDLKIEKGLGWDVAQNNGSRNILSWESTNLIDWEGPRLLSVDIPNATNVWAPEAIFDDKKRRFLMFWASKVSGKHKIFASYTDDFKSMDEPFLFMQKEEDVIDSTIIRREETFYRFTKDETTSRIIMEKSEDLTGAYEVVHSPMLKNQRGVEGPQIFQVTDSKWHLILDRFVEGKGYNILETNDLGSEDFIQIDEKEYDFGTLKKRHGGVIQISKNEYDELMEHFG